MADAVKRCPKCTQELPVSAFYTNRAAYDGLSPYCKPCWLAVTNARHTAKRAGLVDKRRIQMAQVHHDYFSRLDTPIQAYVLGLLASDGTVAADRPRIRFSVHEKDIILTETVRTELAPGSSILFERCNDYQCARVSFTSSQMRDDLARYNVVPRKSHTFSWPQALPLDLANSFLLGVLDGDGWMIPDKRKPAPYYVLGVISGNPIFPGQITEVITAVTGISAPQVCRVGRAWSVRYGGRRAEVVSGWLHRDLPGLARKRLPPG
jgi:hypothetical protein